MSLLFTVSELSYKSTRTLSLFGGALVLVLLLSTGQAARATSEYARKEVRGCQYCHVSGSPGTVVLDPVLKTSRREPVDCNKRGLYYGSHDHSFAGYIEPKAHPNLTPTLFTFVSREILPDSARRIAVAAVAGDDVPRLVTLNAKPDAKDGSVLTVKKWDGKAFVTEFSADTSGTPDKLAVGRFTADGKMVIVTSRAVWYWTGKTFVGKSAAQPLNLMGSVRLRGGGERVLAVVNSTEVRAFRVDLSGSELLTDPVPVPASSQIRQMDMRNTPEFFDKMQMPSELSRGGILGLLTPGKLNKQLLYHVDLDQEIDVKNPVGNEKAQFILKSQGWKVGVIDPNAPSLASQFFTPRLIGTIYDVVTESAHGDGVPGLLILTSEGLEGKGRSLYFFALNTPPPASN